MAAINLQKSIKSKNCKNNRDTVNAASCTYIVCFSIPPTVTHMKIHNSTPPNKKPCLIISFTTSEIWKRYIAPCIMRKAASDKNAASSSELKLTKMLSKLGDSEESSRDVESIFESWDETRKRIKKRFERSWIGFLYENTLLLMSVVSCLQYIYTSYFDALTDTRLIRTSDIVELAFASAFAFDWVLSFCLADHKVMFCYR